MHENVTHRRAGELHPFRNHPFQVRDDDTMEALCESIREYGILTPLLARPAGEGLEIVSGHRRHFAAMRLGLETVPVLIRNMTDEEATILMVDSNLQRENLLPSEKAFAYKMKLDAIKSRGVRNDLTSGQVGHKSRDTISDEDSGRTIQRYIRLTHLIKPLLDLTDEGRIAFSPAVELSFLTREEQAELWDIIQSEDCTPSLSQAVRMKKRSRELNLDPEAILEIMREPKANQIPRLRIELSKVSKFFPRGTSPKQMEQTILRLLAAEADHKK